MTTVAEISLKAEDLPGRNYVAEMRKLLDDESATDEPAPLIALRVVENLRGTDPDLLAGWLDVQAVGIVRDVIATTNRSVRTRARAQSERSAFAEHADEFERGSTDAMTEHVGWLVARFVLEDGRRPTLGTMAKPDLLYVAGRYDDDARSARFEAAFFRAIAKKVGTGTVGDHFTEQQITDLRRSLTPGRPRP